MTGARGWAVMDQGKIDVRTVQHSRIGAIVNWLVVGCGVRVLDRTPDAMIEEMFEAYAAQAGAKAVEVEVTEVAEPPHVFKGRGLDLDDT